MATLTIPEQILARLEAAAAAGHVSAELYLAEVAAADTNPGGSVPPPTLPTQRTVAANRIRELAAEIKSKAAMHELIADKHEGHKY